MNVHVAIGNSDGRLSLAEWSAFIISVRGTVRHFADQIHGEWYSAADSRYQNACFAFEPKDHGSAVELRQRLADLANEYRQRSIAWLEGETEMIGPTLPGVVSP